MFRTARTVYLHNVKLIVLIGIHEHALSQEAHRVTCVPDGSPPGEGRSARKRPGRGGKDLYLANEALGCHDGQSGVAHTKTDSIVRRV